jgi:hypothetical protein
MLQVVTTEDKESLSSYLIVGVARRTDHFSTILNIDYAKPPSYSSCSSTIRTSNDRTAPVCFPLPRTAGFPSYDTLFNHVAGAFFTSFVSSNEIVRLDHDHLKYNSTRRRALIAYIHGHCLIPEYCIALAAVCLFRVHLRKG